MMQAIRGGYFIAVSEFSNTATSHPRILDSDGTCRTLTVEVSRGRSTGLGAHGDRRARRDGSPDLLTAGQSTGAGGRGDLKCTE